MSSVGNYLRSCLHNCCPFSDTHMDRSRLKSVLDEVRTEAVDSRKDGDLDTAHLLSGEDSWCVISQNNWTGNPGVEFFSSEKKA